VPDDPYGPDLRALVGDAFGRLHRQLADDAPTLSRELAAWTETLAGTARPEDYFLDPSAFPMLLLPWWLEEAIAGEHDLRFAGDLVYSSVVGYLAVRLVDDLMDDDRSFERATVPAVIVLQAEFRSSLVPTFPSGHTFWEDLERWTRLSAELAAEDAELASVDRQAFERISARKTIGARIPMAAVAHRYGRREDLEPWLELADAMGRWHQMRNDLRDWARDLALGRQTYVLSEARAAVGQTGSIAGWVVGPGLPWAYGELDRRLGEVREAAARLGCLPLDAYIEQRARSDAEERDDVLAGLPALRALAEAMG
jgi:hypothetical protein